MRIGAGRRTKEGEKMFTITPFGGRGYGYGFGFGWGGRIFAWVYTRGYGWWEGCLVPLVDKD